MSSGYGPITVLGCTEPVFGVAQTPFKACPQQWFNGEQQLGCLGAAGKIYFCPAGKFSSLISQADADAQAIQFLNTLYGQGCGQLQGLLWTLPCTSGTFPIDGGIGCDCDLTNQNSVTIATAVEGALTVRVRVRGVIELNQYAGGVSSQNGNWYAGGSPIGSGENVYTLDITSSDIPEQTFFVNNDPNPTGPVLPINVVVVDYLATIQIENGSVLTLSANSEDELEWANPTGLMVSDDDPNFPIQVSQPYDGQFIQMDILGLA